MCHGLVVRTSFESRCFSSLVLDASIDLSLSMSNPSTTPHVPTPTTPPSSFILCQRPYRDSAPPTAVFMPRQAPIDSLSLLVLPIHRHVHVHVHVHVHAHAYISEPNTLPFLFLCSLFSFLFFSPFFSLS